MDPPWVPKPNVVYARDTGDIAEFSEIKGIELDAKDDKFFKEFSTGAVPIPWQQEMIETGLFDELSDPNRKAGGGDADDDKKSSTCIVLWAATTTCLMYHMPVITLYILFVLSLILMDPVSWNMRVPASLRKTSLTWIDAHGLEIYCFQGEVQ